MIKNPSTVRIEKTTLQKLKRYCDREGLLVGPLVDRIIWRFLNEKTATSARTEEK